MHEDLIGYQFVDDLGNTLEITGPAPWSDQYVLCSEVEGKYDTARAASLVRTHRSFYEFQETDTKVEEDTEESGASSEGSAEAQEG